MTPEVLAEMLRRAARRPGRPVLLLTFDDGYRDFHAAAWPILKRYGDERGGGGGHRPDRPDGRLGLGLRPHLAADELGRDR